MTSSSIIKILTNGNLNSINIKVQSLIENLIPILLELLKSLVHPLIRQP